VGGDEFTILMPNKNRSMVSGIKTRVDQMEQDINGRLRPWGASLSIGIVTLKAEEVADHFLKRADKMMYEQKRNSKVPEINFTPKIIMC
jgi:PleD family two-component response regulator